MTMHAAAVGLQFGHVPEKHMHIPSMFRLPATVDLDRAAKLWEYNVKYVRTSSSYSMRFPCHVLRLGRR